MMRLCNTCGYWHYGTSTCNRNRRLDSHLETRWTPPKGLLSPKLPPGFCTCGHHTGNHHGENAMCVASVWLPENDSLLIGVCDCEGFRAPGGKPFYECEGKLASCKCGVCRATRNAEARRRLKIRHQMLRDNPGMDLPHGTNSTHNNWGCRCTRCCEAHLAYEQARVASRA